MISSAKIKPAELRKNLLKWPFLTRLVTSYDDLFVPCSEAEIWLIEKNSADTDFISVSFAIDHESLEPLR